VTRARPAGFMWPIAAFVAAAAFPAVFGGNAATMSVGTECLIYAVAAASLALLMGYGGQVSLGHAAFVAVGAYTAAAVAIHLHLPLVLEIIASGLITAAVGFVLGLPTGRLHGLYLVILTLGFGVAIPQIALNWTSMTNGWAGLEMPPVMVFGASLASPPVLYYYVLAVGGLCVLAMLSLVSARAGRVFMAVRDGEAAAMAMGVDVWRTKVRVFTASAFFCGVAGDLFAHWAGLVAPTSFPFDLSLLFFAMVVVGGMASIWGAAAAAVLLVIIQDAAASVGGLSTAIIGSAVVLTLLAAPGGLASLPRAVIWRLRGWRARDREAAPPGPEPPLRSADEDSTPRRPDGAGVRVHAAGKERAR
jgi:branched-chain amino acid transport system permease protein